MKQPITLTIGLDAKCIVFGNNVGSDPFSADTFMGLADWIGIVTTCGAPVQEINNHINEIPNLSWQCGVLKTPSVCPCMIPCSYLGTAISVLPSKCQDIIFKTGHNCFLCHPSWPALHINHEVFTHYIMSAADQLFKPPPANVSLYVLFCKASTQSSGISTTSFIFPCLVYMNSSSAKSITV